MKPLINVAAYVLLAVLIAACNPNAAPEKTNASDALAELNAEGDIVNEALKNAKTSEEAMQLLLQYAEKVEEYASTIEGSSSSAEPEKNTGAENKFLATKISQEEIKKFEQQQHRVELNGCSIVYNGKSGNINSVASVLSVLGSDYEKTETYYPYENATEISYFWPATGIRASHRKGVDLGNTTPIISIDFNSPTEEDGESTVFKGSLLLQGVPLYKDKKVVDFVENSTFTFEDINPGNHGYNLFYDCFDGEDFEIEYYLDSTGIWNYKGGGHLMFKDGIDKKNPNPITGVSITKRDKSDYY